QHTTTRSHRPRASDRTLIPTGGGRRTATTSRTFIRRTIIRTRPIPRGTCTTRVDVTSGRIQIRSFAVSWRVIQLRTTDACVDFPIERQAHRRDTEKWGKVIRAAKIKVE